MKTEKLYIYRLEDPTSVSETVYVGFTNNPTKRFLDHLSEAYDKTIWKRYKNCWIRSLLARAVKPRMIIIEEIDTSKYTWQEREIFHIADHKEKGFNLCNLTIGGDGTLGYKHSEETKNKLSTLKIGTVMPEEQRLRQKRQDIDANYIKELYLAEYSLVEIAKLFNTTNHGTIRLHLEDAGVKIREESYTTPRTKDKIATTLTGTTQTEESNAKRSAALVGIPRPLEVREKISKAHTGKTLSAEHKEKLSLAKMGYLAPTYRHDVDTEALVNDYIVEGISLRALGKKYNMEHHAVKARLSTTGIQFAENSKKDTSKFVFNYDAAIKLYNEGLSVNAISKALKCDGKVVKRRLIEVGLITVI